MIGGLGAARSETTCLAMSSRVSQTLALGGGGGCGGLNDFGLYGQLVSAGIT